MLDEVLPSPGGPVFIPDDERHMYLAIVYVLSVGEEVIVPAHPLAVVCGEYDQGVIV